MILPQLLTAGPWQWFYPSRWILEVLERVVNGRAFGWVLLEGVAFALFLVAVYVRARPAPPANSEFDPTSGDEHAS